MAAREITKEEALEAFGMSDAAADLLSLVLERRAHLLRKPDGEMSMRDWEWSNRAENVLAAHGLRPADDAPPSATTEVPLCQCGHTSHRGVCDLDGCKCPHDYGAEARRRERQARASDQQRAMLEIVRNVAGGQDMEGCRRTARAYLRGVAARAVGA
jgi:hypothetical protein